VGLKLLVGPANAGKVSQLLERYLSALEREPILIVPTGSDVERVERELVAKQGCVFGGSIGTFDDVFERIAADGGGRRVATEAQQQLVLRRAVARASLNGLTASAGSSGFADTLREAIRELQGALLEPDRVDGDLAHLYSAYRAELETLGLWDRELRRAHAVARLEADLDAWHGEPVFAYGFEDLTAAEWSLLEALAGRADVTVSIPYEPARAAFTALAATVEDLARLTDGRIQELPRPDGARPPALAHLERELFADAPTLGPSLDGALRFLEAAGTRGTVELVAAEVAGLLRSGIRAETVGIVCDTPERWRASFETVFDDLGIPFALEHPVRLGDTSLGAALLALLRFAWAGAGRGELFAFLRSPYSGIERRAVDFVEGRLRGRAVAEPARVEEEAERLRGAPVPALAELRSAERPVSGAGVLLRTMLRNAWGLEAPPTGAAAEWDARAFRAAEHTLADLEQVDGMGAAVGAEDVLAALERTRTRPARADSGRVAVLDYERARTRSFEVVFLLGLDEGSLPRRGRPSPFLDDERRRELGGRLERPDPVARDRYLFYTACTRAAERVVLVREAANDDGVPREPSPFWNDVRALFDPDDIALATRRRGLSDLTWPIEAAPAERERLRSLARVAVEDEAEALALASANGWTRRLERARAAFERPTPLRNPKVLETFGARTVFSATELERFADCSSAWLVERVVDPKRIDAEPDALLRGQVVHTALNRFYSTLPRELDSERVTPENLGGALELVRRCLDDALESGVRLDLTDLQQAELRHSLLADLEGFVRDEAASEIAFVPRRLEVGFGTDRAAPELQRGLPLAEDLWLSGKIDRIDVDPFSARGIVQDYKSGKGAHSARDIERELRLQIPLYMLALRDLVGLEPLGGVYRALAGRRLTRGMVRASARDDLPGFAKDDYLDEREFWGQVEAARERAADNARRIRAGDVQHDPKGDGCPSWCDLWPICRVARA